MQLKFVDGSSIQVLSIFGGPRLINGVMRDTLRIEVAPETISFEDLKSHFKNNPKTVKLYTIEPSTDGSTEAKESEIGEGYRIFVSIAEEQKRISAPPGKLVPPKYEDIYVVQIAQQTYEEYVSEVPSVEEG